MIRKTGVKAYLAAEGNAGVYLLRRIRGEVAEFTLLTLWESFDCIKTFAGPEPEKAVYFPEDDEYLLEKESEVAHFEVVESHGGAPPR